MKLWLVHKSSLSKVHSIKIRDNEAMKPLTFLFAALSVVLFVRTTEAQVRWYRPGIGAVGYGAGMYGAGMYRGYGGYGGYGGGYSPVEGYQRGMADIIRSRGQAAENVSQANINNQDAYSKYLDNQAKWTNTYWERKRKNQAEYAKNRAAFDARLKKRLEYNRNRKPEVLPPSQFDTQSGELQWPEALEDPIYAEYRKQIDDELQLQADTGTRSNTKRIRDAARQMQDVLKTHIRDMTPNEYLASRKFLDRLVNQLALAEAPQ